MIGIVAVILLFSSIGPAKSFPRCPALALNFRALGIDCDPVFANDAPEDEESVGKILEATSCLGYEGFTVDKAVGCSSPTLPPEMNLEYPCDCKYGGKCNVFCNEGYSMRGSSVLTCVKNGSWTPLPDCVVETCERPKLQATMVWDGKCTCRVGTTCNLTCIDDSYRITPKPQITCMNKVWSPMPKCEKYCRMSAVPEYLEVVEVLGWDNDDAKCNGRENHYCTFRCKNGLVLYGEKNVICFYGSWKNFPSCGCDLSTLPSNVMILSSNAWPAIGSSCDAKCMPHYDAENNFKRALFCDNKGQWDLKKSITCVRVCPMPVPLPSDVKLVGLCSGRQGLACRVACMDTKMKLVGGDSFQCLPSGEYSEFPNCVKENMCSDKAFGKDLIVLPGCRYLVGETCHVKCADGSQVDIVGSSSVTCKVSQTWSEIPKCKSSCEKPDFDSNLDFGSCELQEGKRCHVRCKEGYAAPKTKLPEVWKIYTCLDNGEWDLPSFTCEEVCPEPILDNNTISSPACVNVRVGGLCRLTCRNPNFIMKPKRRITCLNTRKWSDSPKCYRKCLPPNLPSYLELVPGCTFLESEIPCAVRCVNPAASLIGQSNIACTSEGMVLSEVTECGVPCKAPELSKELKTSMCTDLGQRMASCSIQCSDKQKILIGKDIIQCADGKWEIKARCEKRCPAPTLQPNTTLVHECLHLTNFPCHVKCVDPAYTLAGNPSQIIICTEGTWNWTAECDILCPDPRTSLVLEENMVVEPNCPRTRGSQCEVKCLNSKGSGPFLTCEDDMEWHPKKFSCEITCERLDEQPYMALADHRQCNFYAYEKCYVKCIEGRKLIGEPFFYCQESGTWSKIPTCSLACSDLPDHIQSVNGSQSCPRTYDSYCTVACVINGEIQEKQFTHYCSNNGTWDKPWITKEDCIVAEKEISNSCQAPDDMILYDCLSLNMFCYLECKNKSLHILGGESRAFCNTEGKLLLTNQTCRTLEDRPCNASELPPHIHLMDPGPYEIVMYYTVFCNTGYEIMKDDKDKIACEPGGNWGDLPKCVKRCGKGDLAKFGFQVREGKGECWNYPGLYCPIDCLDSVNMQPEKEVVLACREGGEWAPPAGGCVRKENLQGFEERCGQIPSILKKISDDTDPDNPEKQMMCSDDKYMEINGPPLVKCLVNNEFTKLPNCTFKKYFDKEENRTRGRQCKYTSTSSNVKFINSEDCMGEISPVGSICKFNDASLCEKDMTMVCMKNLEWSKPTCQEGQYYVKQYDS